VSVWFVSGHAPVINTSSRCHYHSPGIFNTGADYRRVIIRDVCRSRIHDRRDYRDFRLVP